MSIAPQVTSKATSDDPKQSMAIPLKLTDQTNLLPFRKIVPLFSGIALCAVVSVLDSVIIATALPTISAAFNAGSVASWVPSAYMLTSTSVSPLCGRFSDIFGRKAVLCVAMAVFMLGSLASGFSKSIIQLIIFRGVAGAGGDGVLTLGQIILSDVVSLRDRGKYQGFISGFVSLGFVIGPPIGGALSETVSWRARIQPLAFIQVINPWQCSGVFGSISPSRYALYVWLFLYSLSNPSREMKLLAIDYIGAGLTLLGSTLVILPLIWGGVTFPWDSPLVLAPLCSGVLVIFHILLLGMERRKIAYRTHGAWAVYIFKHVTVTGVYITMFINGFIFFSSLYYLSQFFQVALGYSPIRSWSILASSARQPNLCQLDCGDDCEQDRQTIIYAGFSVWAVGCGCLSTVTASTSKALLVFYMVLVGSGAGQTLQTATVAAQASVPRKDMAVVTAVRNYIRLLGGALSMAVGSMLTYTLPSFTFARDSFRVCNTRNNHLRSVLSSLSLTPSAMTTIIDNPTILGSHASPSQLASLGLTPSQAAYALLHGYTAGFRILFILNACLASVATITSIFMIKHKEAYESDEERLQAEARQLLGGSGNGNQGAIQVPPSDTEDPELGGGTKVDLEMGQPEGNSHDRVVCVKSGLGPQLWRL
ncbi:major facilitator superfamily domain-containing protein [Melanogaster broomeanus]|nr:major facilitator superfamily domain-containing protein [Melanogaster broomeanus]